jgi:hypothetical protein
MDLALAVVGLVGIVLLAASLFMRALRTFAELRKVSTSLSILGWALEQAPTDPPRANGGRRIGSG